MDEPTRALAEVAERLYAGSTDDFTPARNAAAKELKASGDKDLAAAVTRLRKPSVAAWAVNLLVRRETDQIDTVLAMGESLRAAAEALDGDELRALTRQRRQLTTALASSARSLAREHGVRLTEAVVDQVEGVLTAAMLDPVAAQVVRTGRVVTAFTSTGVSDLDVETVVAVPDALEVRAEHVEEDVPAPPELRVVPDDTARIAQAEDALEDARVRVAEARQELAELDSSLERLQARRLQLQGEADELRRRLARIEEDVDGVDDELEEADAARDDAVDVLDEAERVQDRAQQALDALRG